MSLFKRRRKVDIQIIKTEPLKKRRESGEPDEAEAAAAPEVLINVLGKQQLREQFSDDELQVVAEQTYQEIARLALPEIVQKAQEARKAWKIDEAIVMLRQHARRSGASPELEQELETCLNSLDENTYFQHVGNGQLAAILFDASGFRVDDRKSPEVSKDHPVLETRLTVACEDDGLRPTLETVAGSPQRYYCYCLAEYERPLDNHTLGLIQADYKKRELSVNGMVHFAVCKESNPAMNMHINVNRFAEHFITIPLERDEMRRTVVNDTAEGYLRSKIEAWNNHRLFAATLPVTGPDEFFGRENDLKQISGLVRSGQSFYVLGSRRMGKTSLIRHLANLGAFRNHLYAFLDLEGFLHQPNFDRAVDDILRQWSEMLQRKHPKIAQGIHSRIPDVGTSSHDRLSAFLDGIRSAIDEGELEIRCLAILDDINVLLTAIDGEEPLWKRGASQLVRLLRHRQDLVITGLALWDFEAVNTVEREPGGGLGKYTPIYLEPLDREECRTMVEYVGGIVNMEFTPESLEVIYEETGGHPFWTRLLCDSISRTRRSCYPKLVVTPSEVKQAADEFPSLYKRFMVELLESLTGTEQRILRELAHPSGPVQLDQAPDSSMREVLTHLKYYGLVEELPARPGRYGLRMRLLAQYLQSL